MPNKCILWWGIYSHLNKIYGLGHCHLSPSLCKAPCLEFNEKGHIIIPLWLSGHIVRIDDSDRNPPSTEYTNIKSDDCWLSKVYPWWEDRLLLLLVKRSFPDGKDIPVLKSLIILKLFLNIIVSVFVTFHFVIVI